jgi:hypothetical protein
MNWTVELSLGSELRGCSPENQESYHGSVPLCAASEAGLRTAESFDPRFPARAPVRSTSKKNLQRPRLHHPRQRARDRVEHQLL